MKRILKYALLVIKKNKILLQIEKKQDKLLLPGGKPHKNEDYLSCLKREIKEELGTEIKEETLRFLGSFEDVAASEDAILRVELYTGELAKTPKPRNEVKRLVWFGKKNNHERLSPVIRNEIMPYLDALRIIK